MVFIDVENDDEFLYFLCDWFGIIGLKYGCGVGVCGVCIIFKDGELVCLCIVLMEEVEGVLLIIIEGFVVDDILYLV